MLMRTDIRDSSRMLQRNMKTIRTWLEESQTAASTCVLRPACRSCHFTLTLLHAIKLS